MNWTTTLAVIGPSPPRPNLVNKFHPILDGYWTLKFTSGSRLEKFCMFPVTHGDAVVCREYNPPDRTGDAAALNLLKTWITNCMENHENCSKNVTPDILPTRLLDISEPTVIRLVDTQDAGITEPYITLSHCWGKSRNHLTLTSENRYRLQQGIPVSELPLTFREAAHVTRYLGYKYIWIDSLCIIQSGEEAAEDWAREVRMMASVYSNCVLNLAASDAQNSSEGMFRQRDPNAVSPLCIDIPTAVLMRERGLHWRVSAESRPHVLITSESLERGIGHFSLDTRAWVCQERLLSVRTAHFARNQIFWECQSRPFASESVPCSIDSEHTLVQTHGEVFAIDPAKPNEHPIEDIEATSMPLLASPSITWMAHDRIAQTQRWFNILTNYTTRNLTRATDKLPAIGAVAQRIGEALNDQYALGCFRSHLPYALLWQGGNGFINSSKSSKLGGQMTYIAPSWSWASTTQPINFEECWWTAIIRSQPEVVKRHTFAELVDIHTDLVDRQNPFGEVTAGHVVLRAPLAQIPPGTKPRIFRGHPMVDDMECLASEHHSLRFDEAGPAKCQIGDNVHLLPIAWRMGPATRPGGVPHMREFGLMVSREADGAYSRIGIFQGSYVSSCSKTPEWGWKTPNWGYPKKMIREIRLV
jgi:hypothetical protein